MLHKLTIGQRLSLLLGVLMLFSLLLGLNGLDAQRNILADFSSTYHDRVVPLQQLKRVSDAYAVNIVDAAHKLRAGSMARDTFLKELDASRAVIQREWQAYRATALTDEERRLSDEAAGAMRPANQAVDTLKGIAKSGDAQALQRFVELDMYPAIDPVTARISTLIDLQLKVAAEEYASAEVRAGDSARLSMSLIAASVLLAALLGFVIIRRLLSELGGEPRDVVALAGRIAAGDLTQRLAVRHGDTHSVVASMAHMQSSLIHLVHQLEAITGQLSVNATELAAASEQVAVSAEEQTRATSAMSASVEQLSVSIASVSDNARDAAGDAATSGHLAHEGESMIAHTLSTIQQVADMARESRKQADQLGNRSQQISNVVAIIRDVAEQTNLLALNAAIEAARAGEHGRGFAVVADEVRKLSERTGQSTREISSIVDEMLVSSAQVVDNIHSTVESMESGLQQVGEARETIRRIDDSVERIDRSVAAISAALSQQQSASGDIAGNVEQIAQMSEETSSAASQSANSASQLEQMAHELKAAISHFSLPEQGRTITEQPPAQLVGQVAWAAR